MCDLQEVLVIIETLQQLCARFYGPRCAQTLLTSNTGKAVVTSDGLTILETISLGHPIANLIVATLKKCHSYTYDGSKTFLLYLKLFSRKMLGSINKGHFSGIGINRNFIDSSSYKHSKVCASKTVHDILVNVLPDVYLELQQHPSVKQAIDKNKVVNEILKKVCEATLCPHFNPRVCKHFAEVLIQVVSGISSIEGMREVLHCETLKFSQLIIKVTGRNYTNCTIFQPFLVKKSKYFLNFTECNAGDSLKAVCLQLSDEDTDKEEPDIGMMITNALQINDSILVKRKNVATFAKACLQLNIKLIISSSFLPEYTIGILHEHKLSVINNVLKEDIDLLELFTHSTSIVSLLDKIEENNIMSFYGMEEVEIGSEQFIHLKSDMLSFKHVIVCAPSPGLCDHTALLLQKALNTMCLSLETNPDTERFLESGQVLNESDSNSAFDETNRTNGLTGLNIVPVGGTFELILSKLLSKRSKIITDPHIKEICHVLSESMTEVVGILYENTKRSSNQNKSRFISIHTEILQRIDEGKVAGLNSHGDVVDEDEDILMEPLQSKIHVLHSVLNLMVQFLRIDDVVPVKKH